MVQALQLKPLELYVDPVAKPVDTRLGALMSYWRAKRQGTAALPTRGDIRPGELISHLPSLIMLDVEETTEKTPDFAVRLSGTALDDLFGGNYMGRKLEEILPPKRAWLARAALGLVVEHRRPMRFFGRLEFPSEPGNKIMIEALALPLSRPDGQVHMILGEIVQLRAAAISSFPELCRPAAD
ncbi:conserved protein [Tepidicaulis marinus]|uniref:Conserved protein n=1 Tax=Tepidicaulis marinus TaxID=1333998 RepID=A0A081B776_9HYPH|nr:PAS domain-containing protein [Tepidicaulis marinus]GAK43894.1 conserved protein [Tepidicaulis marinus]